MLYLVIVTPSLVMTLMGFRYSQLLIYDIDVSFMQIMIVDIMTKVAFGLVLLPCTYLFGFILRNNNENLFKILGLILYFFGHILSMIMLTLIDLKLKSFSTF